MPQSYNLVAYCKAGLACVLQIVNKMALIKLPDVQAALLFQLSPVFLHQFHIHIFGHSLQAEVLKSPLKSFTY